MLDRAGVRRDGDLRGRVKGSSVTIATLLTGPEPWRPINAGTPEASVAVACAVHASETVRPHLMR